MKCVYDPNMEAENKCSRCHAPLCNSCFTDAELNEGLCQLCRKELRGFKIARYIQLFSCGLGIVWLVVAFIIFNEPIFTELSYGLIGILGAFVINFVAVILVTRLLLMGLSPEQRVIVGLHRYAVTGMKNYFEQAVKRMEKVQDMKPYQDALFDQIVTILILQPYDLPEDWVEYLSEKFHFSPDELLTNILEYGTDVFYENIFKNYNYQAMEPFIEILKQTDNDKLFIRLIDDILTNLETVDLAAVTRPQPYMIPGAQAQPQREEPKVVRERAFLTELKLIENELEEYMIKIKRNDDFQKIKEKIDQFDLPAVPKNTFDAVKMLTAPQQMQQQQQQQQTATTQQPAQIAPQSQAPGLIAPPQIAVEQEKEGKVQVRTCAECGNPFPKDQLQSYTYKEIQVKVCNDCMKVLKKDKNRKPKMLENM